MMVEIRFNRFTEKSISKHFTKHTLPMYRTDLIPKYIIACCILHNICLLKNDVINIPIIVNEHNPAQIETLDDTQRELH